LRSHLELGIGPYGIHQRRGRQGHFELVGDPPQACSLEPVSVDDPTGSLRDEPLLRRIEGCARRIADFSRRGPRRSRPPLRCPLSFAGTDSHVNCNL
jgi:hypothetical protein